jgi:hypothetical protein
VSRARLRRLTPCLLVVALSTSLPHRTARAEDEATKVRVTTFLLSHEGVEDALLVAGMRALDDALRRNPRLEMKDLDTRLADFAQEIPSEQVDEGRRALADGEKALSLRELTTALRQLRQAVDVLSRVLPFIKKQELAEAMLALGVTYCESGDKKACRAQFTRLLVWRSDHKYDPTKFPDKHLGLFEEVKKEVLAMRRGSLEIRSEPPAAQAYVDGRYVGVTPAFAEGLIVGDHFITLKREGYRKAVQPVSVSGKVQGLVELKLERSGKFLLVEQALRSVEKELGHDRLEGDIDNLKEVLYLDHAVFVRAKRIGAGRLRLECMLYDLRSHRRLSTETREIAEGETEKVLAQQASALYVNVRYEADLVAPKDEPIPITQQKRKAIYRRWWFWTVIGAVAVGVAATTGVVVDKYRPRSCGEGNYCPGFTF